MLYVCVVHNFLKHIPVLNWNINALTFKARLDTLLSNEFSIMHSTKISITVSRATDNSKSYSSCAIGSSLNSTKQAPISSALTHWFSHKALYFHVGSRHSDVICVYQIFLFSRTGRCGIICLHLIYCLLQHSCNHVLNSLTAKSSTSGQTFSVKTEVCSGAIKKAIIWEADIHSESPAWPWIDLRI